MKNFKRYLRIIRSDKLLTKLRLKKLPTFVPWEEFILKDDCGNECRVSMINLKAMCQKYLLNPHLVNHLLDEADCHLNSSSFTSIMDSSIAARIRGKLKLEVYLDETGLAPSGPLQKKHNKYLKVFVTIADLPFEKRCKPEDIELAMIVNKKELDALVMDKDAKLPLLFEKFKTSLDELMQNGIDIKHRGKEMNIGVTLSTVCGDNLGMLTLISANKKTLRSRIYRFSLQQESMMHWVSKSAST